MMVLAAAPHRRAAFEAADFLMDYLKSRAPFWKKELGPGGGTWVLAKEEDEAALSRWDRTST
jgi:molybdopterin synthase catalytic subunit